MLYAQHIVTEDVRFVGPDFVRQWQEAETARPHYAYIIPEPGEPQWPYVVCYFSRRKFTRRELRQLCQWDDAPLRKREATGEDVCGFRWPLDEVACEAVTATGAAILATVGLQQEVTDGELIGGQDRGPVLQAGRRL